MTGESAAFDPAVRACLCQGKGLIRIRHEDGSPDVFAVCLCAVGESLRDDRNAGHHTGYPRWMIWAAKHQVSGDQIAMVEEVLEDEELAKIKRPAPSSADAASSSAIAAAMQTRRPRL